MKTGMTTKPETRLVEKIMNLLQNKYSGYYFKLHGGAYQRMGFPDIIGCHEGRFVGIEVKLPGKEDTYTKIQRKQSLRLKNAGAIVFVATTVEEVNEQMQEKIKTSTPPTKGNRKGSL